jgi:hypothetical protein
VRVGGVAEWSNAPVLKTDEGESPPRVRIPVPPPPSPSGSPDTKIVIKTRLLLTLVSLEPILDPEMEPRMEPRMEPKCD